MGFTNPLDIIVRNKIWICDHQTLSTKTDIELDETKNCKKGYPTKAFITVVIVESDLKRLDERFDFQSSDFLALHDAMLYVDW